MVWWGAVGTCVLVLLGAHLLTRSFPEEKPLDERFSRIEFLQERIKSVMEVKFLVKLDREYTPDELGHFRILLEVIQLGSGDPNPTLWLAARDSYPVWHSGKQATKLDGTRTIVWSRNPDEKLQDTVVGAAVGRRIPEILAWGTINHRGPFQTIESFDHKWLNIFVTQSLADKLTYVGFAVDNYVLMGMPAHCLEQTRGAPLVEWPDQLSEKVQTVAWVHLLPRRYWPDDSSRPPLRPPLLIDFGKFTPAKLEPLGELRGWPPVTVPTCELSELWPP
jgi:hypothetical protein